MDKQLILNEYYILYVDILGYKNKMDRLKNDSKGQSGFLNEINDIVQDCYKREHEKRKRNSPIKVKVFSDNIIFAIKVLSNEYFNNKNIEKLCSIASRMQEMFLKKYRILFRGSITRGQLYIDEHFVFGQGIIDAYILENNFALYPRIIIDKKIENSPYIVNSKHRIDSSLLFDDYKFINFLCYYIPGDDYESKGNIYDLKTEVNLLLNDTPDTRALQKIKWVNLYIENLITKYNLLPLQSD